MVETKNVKTLEEFQEQTKLLLWYKNPAKFFEDVFGRKPFPYQEKVLKELSDLKIRRVLITASGGSGKTMLVAGHALWLAVPFAIHEKRPVSIVIISGSQNQARTLYGYIKEALKDDKFLQKFVEGDITQSSTKFKNGSIISAVPNSHKAIQSLHKDVVVIDEPCVLPNTLIYNKYGAIRINAIEENDNTTYAENNVTKIYKRYVNEEIINIIPYFMREGLKLTKNHPIYCIKKKKYDTWDNLQYEPEWVRAEDVKKGDILVYDIPEYEEIPYRIKIKSELDDIDVEVNEDIAWLLGLFLADGCSIITETDNTISFTLNKDNNKHDRVVEIVNKYFKKKCHIYNDHKSRCYKVCFSGIKIAQFLRDNFYNLEKKKRIPNWIFHLPKKIRSSFLCGWLEGDETHCYVSRSIEGTTSSKELYPQLVNLMLSLDIIPSVKKWKSHNVNGYNCRDFLIFSHKQKQGKIIGNKLYVIVRDVKHIKYSGAVYNLEVVPNQYYLSFPFKLHNCLAGDFVIDDAKRIVVKDNSLDRIILLGTPFVPPETKIKSTKFIDMWVNKELFPEWRRYHWNAMDCPNVTAEQIEEARKSLPEEMFSVFWLGEPYFSGESLIQLDHLREASMNVHVQYDPSIPSVAGVDWGFKHETSLTIAQKRDGIWYVVFNDGWRLTEYEDVQEKIHQICKQYNVDTIYADAEAIGENQRLEAKGNRVVPIHFVKYKIQLQANLQILFVKKKIKIDEEMIKLKDQLRRYQWDTKLNDDRVDSLMLAVNNIFEEDNSIPLIKVL